ncbi:VCBS domain-containing protein [Oceanimonas baumannii]|uniref:VCBS domain-containing protein n=1 Tax=Oceanimonas baumannii TaxID=129578 RepID=UPI001064A803|nr:VCBS domain-containing protein [Oceanimonas baumannii]
MPNNNDAITPDADNTDQVVFESGLSDGSQPNETDTQVSSQFTLKALDGLAETDAVTISYTDVNGLPATLTLSKAQVEELGTSSQSITTEYGELVLKGYSESENGTITLDYDYTLTTAPGIAGDDTLDSFTITASDRDGDSHSDDLTIKIVDDAPVAKDDTNSVTEEMGLTATGNVINNGSAGDVADTTGADGATVSGVTSTNVSGNTATETDGTLVIDGQYGTLTINADGSYTYELDNGNLEVQGLTEGESLDEVFNYTLSDGDTDVSNANLTITINGSNDGVSVDVPDPTDPADPNYPTENPDNPTSPTWGSINDHVVFESGLSTGSAPNGNDILVDSSFTLSALDGLDSITFTVNGTETTLSSTVIEALDGNNPQTIPTEFGELVLNGYTLNGDGTITIDYEYTLTSAPENGTLGDAGTFTDDTINITVNDTDTDADSQDLVIRIVDDAPVAKDDTNSVTEEMGLTATGNVINNGSAGDVADTTGADGATVSGVTSTNVSGNTATETEGTLVIDGQYGTLTINADGSYTYKLDNGNLKVQGLTEGESLDEVFNYTLSDGDTDVSNASLTITINGSNDGVSVDVPDPTDPADPNYPAENPDNPTSPTWGSINDHVVFESGLSTGSAPNDNDILVDSSFILSALDGLDSITFTVNGTETTLSSTVIEALNGNPQTIPTEFGELVLNGYTLNSDGTITLDYEYTLTSAPENGTLGDAGTFTDDTINITVNDTDTDADSQDLVIRIVDDAPVAKDDTNSIAEDVVSVTGNVIANGAATDVADTTGADGATVTGVVTGTVAEGAHVPDSSLTITGKYGTLTLNPDGGYTYTLDNDNQIVQGLTDGEALNDEVFSYTITDQDGDKSTATVTITINGADDSVTVDVPHNNEATTPDGNITDQVVFESGLSNGSSPKALDTQVSNQFTLVALDGLADVTISYTDVNGQPATLTLSKAQVEGLAGTDQTITTQYGELVLNGFSQGTDGTITIDYDYTLTTAPEVTGEDTNDRFTIAATDRDGDTNSGDLTIKIVDDVPVAVADTDNVTEGNTLTVDASNGVLGNDKSGADGWAHSGNAVVGVEAGNSGVAAENTSVGQEIVGQYGTLTLNADGSYTYVANANSITAEAQDVFTYTVKDSDGDLVETTLTIDVADVTGSPVDTAGQVNEAGLADGTAPDSNGEKITNGSLDLQPGWNVDGPQSGSASFGDWTVNADGTFSYTLTQRTEDVNGQPETDSFTYIVVDEFGNTVENTVTITIVDDAPVAVADTDKVTEGETLTVDANNGVLGNDKSGADGWANNGNAVVGVEAGNSGVAAENTSVGQEIVGQYGTLTLNADGSYTYVANANSITADAQDVFTYTVKDSDGDLVETTLTIDVADVTGSPVDTAGQVNEAGLANGTAPDSNGEKITNGSLDLQPGWNVDGPQSGSASFGDWTVNADGTFNYTLTGTTTDLAGDETDSFTYTAVDQFGNTVTNTVTITIVDDAPVVSATGTLPDNLIVDETTLGTEAKNSFAGAFDYQFGADGAAATDSVVYTLEVNNSAAGLADLKDTATGDSIKLVLENGTVKGVVDGGTADGETVFTVTVDADGNVTLTQQRPMIHGDPKNPDDAFTLPSDSIKLTATATDKDGDSDSASIELGGQLEFKDDGPAITAAPAGGTVDEAYLAKGSIGTEDPAQITVSNSLNVDFGTDGAGDVQFTAGTAAALKDLGLTSADKALAYEVSTDGHTLIAYKEGESSQTPVFTVVITDPTGTPGYQFILNGALDHVDDIGNTVDELGLVFDNIQVTDKDGDSVDTGFTITVKDDAVDPSEPQLVTVIEDSVSEGAGNTFNTNADATGDNTSINDGTPDTEGWVTTSHGRVKVNADGTISYEPAPNYSGKDSFTYTTITDNDTKTYTVEVTVKPVSDAPDIPHGTQTGDVDAVVVQTKEDTSVALGLKVPVITDNTDENGAAEDSGDDPERLGEITLSLGSSAPAGTVLTKGDGSALVSSDGVYKFVITDVADLHLNGLTTANDGSVNYVTQAEYEAIKAQPADDRHENFDVVVSVDSYEVNSTGNKLPDSQVSGTNGSNSQQTITVDVQAVTDAPGISLTEAGNTGATSIAVTEASGGNNGKITVSMEEDGTLNLQDVLGETLKDTDGSESYWYDISGLPAGTVVTINGKKYTADSEGNISMPEADYMNTNNGGNPGFSIKLPTDYSNSTADKVTITLNTKDSDGDSSVTTTTESVSVDLELRVYAKPDDVKLENPDATPEDTAVAFLDKLGLNDTDGSESITQVRITDFPTEGGTWILYDHSGDPVTVPDGGDASGGGLILTVGTGVGEYTLDQIKEFTLQPPAHSSSDGTIKVYITTEEDGANTASGNPESQEWAHDLNITVTPVAEDANTDSDGSHGVDVTINPSHEYTTAGNEDEFMLLGKDAGFSLETGWSNEDGKAPNGEGTGVTGGDGSEETFALLTPYDVVGNNAQINETGNPLDGSVFRYKDASGEFKGGIFNGEPVKIPVEYLDSLEFKGPANFSGVVKIKVEAGTVDYDEDTGAATNMAVSGESWLTNVIVHPVADQVTLKVNARITTDEDVPVALNINPTSSDSDETFNVTISGIPAGATITYNGVEYSEANGNITGGSLIIEDFDASKQPTLTPPKDSNESIDLKVEAVSVDTLTYIDKNGVEVHSPVDESLSQELDINITVQGVPDEPKLELVQDKVYVEQDLDDAAGANQVALSDLITSFGSGETSGDGSEAVTLRLSGLPDGFNLVGAGSVLGGSGPDRVWVIDENQLSKVKITLPPNYSGSVSFTAQPVVTENDNDSETFFDPENIGFTVTPSPEADLSVSSNLTEDTIGKLDLSAVHQNGDTDEFITEVKIKAVDGFTFYSDADGTTELIPGADGYYVFSGADVNSVYVKADANFSGTQRLEVEYYKVTDPSTDGNVDEVTVQKGTATHDLIVGAVTDNIGAELNTITAVVSGEDSFNFDDTTGTATVNGTGKVTVKVDISQQADANAGNKTDTDGSEQLTHIVIDGVPQGVNVEGAVQTAPGQWLINTSDSFNADTLTKDLVFNVTGLAGTGTSAITVTGYSKDTGASSQKQAEISFNLDINQGPGPDTELPDVELSDKNTVQTEDSGFSLAEQVVGTITGGNVDSYQITVTLRTSPDDDTVFTDASGVLLTRTEVTENGETVVLWTKSVDVASGDNADTKLAGLLDEIKVLAPEHANNNNLPGGLPLDVTVSVHADGLSKQDELKPSVNLTPATDETTVTVAAAPAGEGEDISLNISLENLPDGGFSNVEGDILYVQLGDTGLAGELLDADGNTLEPNDVTGVYEIPLEANGQPPALTFRPDSNQPHQTGSLTVNAWVNNQETGASNIIKSEGNGTLIIEKSNSGFEATITAEGDEQTQDLTTPAPIELNLAGQGLVDTDEVIDAAFINGLPPGFVVYVGADAATAGLANNAGKDANGNNIWSLPITDPSGLPGYIAVVPPKNWSGTLDGLKLTVMSGETGLAPTGTEIGFDLVVNPLADGITINPTLSFGDAGDVIKLNLNAAMKDPVANDFTGATDGHTERTTLELEGFTDGEKTLFYVEGVEIAAERVSFADGKHTITGLTQEELDGLGFVHSGMTGDITVTATTQEVDANGNAVGAPSASATGSVAVNVSDKLPTTGDDNLLWTGDAINGRDGEDTIQLRFGEELTGSELAANLDNIEVLDMTSNGASKIDMLSASDVLDMTDTGKNLRIEGNTDEDSLTLGDGWDAGTSLKEGYTTYTSTDGNNITLEVSNNLIVD